MHNGMTIRDLENTVILSEKRNNVLHFPGQIEVPPSAITDMSAAMKPFDFFDAAEGMFGKPLTIPPCRCGADNSNHWDHATNCIWKGCSSDRPYDNAMKLEVERIRNEQAMPEERYVPLKPMEGE